MMIENADQTIQHAQKQEKTAFQAKKHAFHELQESIDRRYGEDLLEHHKVRDYAVEVKPSYESTAIGLYLHILPSYGVEETIKEIRDSDIEEDYRVAFHYKEAVKQGIRETVLKDLDIETDLMIRVKTKEQFERLRK